MPGTRSPSYRPQFTPCISRCQGNASQSRQRSSNSRRNRQRAHRSPAPGPRRYRECHFLRTCRPIDGRETPGSRSSLLLHEGLTHNLIVCVCALRRQRFLCTETAFINIHRLGLRDGINVQGRSHLLVITAFRTGNDEHPASSYPAPHTDP